MVFWSFTLNVPVCVCVCVCVRARAHAHAFHVYLVGLLHLETCPLVWGSFGHYFFDFFFSCLLSWSSCSADVEHPGLYPPLPLPVLPFYAFLFCSSFFFLNMYISLKYRWLTVFPVCSKVIQLYMYTYYFWNYFPL